MSGFWRRSLIATTAVALLTGALAAHALGASGFTDFQGAWSGAGSLARADGESERLRCSATYALRGENTLSQSLRCRSDTTSFDLANVIQNDGGKISGEWLETTRNARGRILGRLGQGSMQGAAQGPGFNAAISVSVRGGRQVVTIRSDAGDIRTVNISMRKGR